MNPFHEFVVLRHIPIVLLPSAVMIPTLENNVVRMGCESSVVTSRNKMTEVNSSIIRATAITTRLVVIQILLIYLSQFFVNSFLLFAFIHNVKYTWFISSCRIPRYLFVTAKLV